MLLFVAKRGCVRCDRVLRFVRDHGPIGGVTVFYVPPGGAPECPDDIEALEAADWHNVTVTPTLIVGNGDRITGPRQIIKTLKDAHDNDTVS